MAWKSALVDMTRLGEFAGRGLLTNEQRGRLWDAIPAIWLADKATGATEDEWRTALGYLPSQWRDVREAWAALLLKDDGTWRIQAFSDEALRQESVSMSRQETGRRGGEANAKRLLSKRKQTGSEKKPSSSSSLASKTENLKDLCDESHVSPKDSLKENPRKDWREAFDLYFWPEYYRLRQGLPNPKAKALAAWLKVRAPSQDVFDQVMREFDACKQHWSDPQYIPHASTWLNARIIGGVFYPSEALNGSHP